MSHCHTTAAADDCQHLRRSDYKSAVIALISCAIFIAIASNLALTKQWAMDLAWYLKRIAIPISVGLFIGGCIDYLIPRSVISAIFSHRRKRTIGVSVIFGFLMSVCSHGILAIAMELYKKGASTSAVVAFLLASPWANLPLTILLVGFFGIKGLFFIIAALLIAIITGLCFQFLESKKWVEIQPIPASSCKRVTIAKEVRTHLEKLKTKHKTPLHHMYCIFLGMAKLSNMVLPWIFFGAALAAATAAYMPNDWLHKYMGPSIGGLSATLLVATLMEVCSEGMAPLAFEIYRQTGALGNAFVFLMAGVVTDYTEIGLLWKNIGRRTAILLPIIAVPQVVLLGLLANYLL